MIEVEKEKSSRTVQGAVGNIAAREAADALFETIPKSFEGGVKRKTKPTDQVIGGSISIECPVDDCVEGKLLDGRECHECGGLGNINVTVTGRVTP